MAIKYLKKYALSVTENGYDICFIRPGEKRPFGKDWEAKKHGPKMIQNAIDNGRGHFGVGIKTEKTAGVDVDCYDEDIVNKVIRRATKRIGKTIQRIGLFPKTLMVYRVDEAFSKTQSKVFIDDEGRAVKLEVLSDGQQFVAFHIHPDTEKPYYWIDDVSVLDVPHDELEPIDRDQALDLVAYFEKLCREKGWKEKSTVKRLTSGKSGGRINYDDPFISDKAKVDLSAEQLLKKLNQVPNADDYDTWFHVGMALYHQFDGSDEGLLMWHQWSSDASNYDMEALDEKWATFDVEGKKREPLTARFILKQAKDAEEELATETLEEIQKDIKRAGDMREFQTVMDKVKTIAFPPMLREQLAITIKERLKKATDTLLPIGMIRKAIAFENPEHRATPAWLRDWVFIQHDETLYNRRTRQVMSTKAFDLSNGRFLLTKKDILEGISTPEHSASHVAVNRYQIPAVANKMYAPLEDEFFEANKLSYVNSYSDLTVPEDVPDELNRKERRMVKRVVRHLEHLFANERDRKLLLSWLAYIVQTNSKINWAPVIQGVENDGKSFFGRMMAVIIGGENVNVIDGEAFAEKYTNWAEGCQFLMVEEVRLHGMDRFAVINRVKPFISNDFVTIRRMNTDRYKVLNTVNYFLTTNHKDGVPINDNSTRYFPMFSRWQTKVALDKFNAENPDYYKELHEVLEHGGALRRWLMDYELHPEFSPVERARESSSRKEMLYLNQTEEEEGLAEILDKNEAGCTRELLDSSVLAETMHEAGLSVPYGRAWKQMLSEAGFTYLGPVNVNGKTRKYWSQTPAAFVSGDKINTIAIRDTLDPI